MWLFLNQSLIWGWNALIGQTWIPGTVMGEPHPPAGVGSSRREGQGAVSLGGDSVAGYIPTSIGDILCCSG